MNFQFALIKTKLRYGLLASSIIYKNIGLGCGVCVPVRRLLYPGIILEFSFGNHHGSCFKKTGLGKEKFFLEVTFILLLLITSLM